MNVQSAVIKAVCISEKKGQQKHPIESIHLRPKHGIDGDAHAGNWHRQVSLLGQESVDRLQEKISTALFPGAFAENILCEGIELLQASGWDKTARRHCTVRGDADRQGVSCRLCDTPAGGRLCHAAGRYLCSCA